MRLAAAALHGSVAVGLVLASVLVPAVGSQAVSAGETKLPARVAIVMSLSLPIGTGSFVDAKTLDESTAPGGILATELDAVFDRNVTLAIDPMLIASIRVLGSAAPANATAWLDRLKSASNESFALTYADSDLTAPLQADPKRGTALRSLGLDFTVGPSGTAAPTPLPTSTSSSPPSTPAAADLVAWTYSMQNVAWPQADTVVKKDLPAIIASKFGSAILASKNVTRTDKTSASAVVSKLPVFVADETISSLLVSAADTTSSASAINALDAAISSYAQRGTSTSLVLTLDRSTPTDGTRLAQILDSISALENAELVDLGDIPTAATAKATLVDRPQSVARLKVVKMLLDAERMDRDFSTVAENPRLITSERRTRLLVTLSAGAAQREGGWDAATAEFLAESTALRNSVRIVQSSELLLAADRQSIPVSIDNDLNQPVTVLVTVSPSLPLIAVEDSSVEVKVDAGSQTKGLIPVQSLSNGEVELRISIRSPTGMTVGAENDVHMSVRAGWEGPVTVVLAVLVVLLFLFGIFRTVVRRRAPRAAESDQSGE